MNGHGDFKWMVSIADETFSNRNGSKSKIVQLNDPSTNSSRQYIQLSNNSHDLVETQSLESDFSSFLVGRHVVKDGNLYVMNRVDPLFWFFSQYSHTEQCKQWRPVDQVVECLPDVVQKALDTDQIPHLFQVLNSEAMGDTPFFKFVPERALKWLQQKHQRIFHCLEIQEKAKREQSKKKLSKSSRGGGSASASFYMPEDTTSSAPQTETDPSILSNADIQMLKLDSAQIISNYLPPEWSKALMDHLGLAETEAKVTQQHQVKRPVVSPTASPDKPEEIEKPKKKVVEAQTIGNKRLAKVSTKGMKSLASFFGGPTTKKKKVQ